MAPAEQPLTVHLFSEDGIMAEGEREQGSGGLDPAVRHGRREAAVVLIAVGVSTAWTVIYCALAAYEAPGPVPRLVLGMPAWVFWGVLAPWGVATAFTLWFALFFMRDDDPGAPPGGEEAGAPPSPLEGRERGRRGGGEAPHG